MVVDFTNGSADNIDIYQMQTQTLLAGIADPDLKNKDLLEKFGAVLPGDIKKLIQTDGEVQAMYRLHFAIGHEAGIRRTSGVVCLHPL